MKGLSLAFGSVSKRIVAAFLALVLAVGMMVPTAAALADETSAGSGTASAAGADTTAVTTVQTATVTPSYTHPTTGAVEDSGSQSSAVLGQSMVEGATFNQALVEVDADENTWVTFRFNLADELSDISVAYDADGSGSAYQDLTAQEMQRNTTDNTMDYRVQAPGTDGVFRIGLYVGAMGRSVVYFATLSDLVEGNAACFVQSVEAGQPLTSALEAQAAAEEAAAAAAEAEAQAQAAEEAAANAAAMPWIIGGIVAVVLVAVIIAVIGKRRKQGNDAE